MIRIQYASDLHLEFVENEQYLSQNFFEKSGDILLLAGDVVLLKYEDRFRDFFKKLSNQYDQVLWIPGNHEYYRGNILSRESPFNEEVVPNVHLLNNNTFTFNNVHFICSTLWANVPDDFIRPVSYGMNDFRVIQRGNQLFTVEDFNRLHDDSIKFIVTELEHFQGEKCVVMTHHVPTFLNYPPKYLGSALNFAFAVEHKEIIERYQPEAWIFGHVHCPADFTIGQCKMLANPLGYVKSGENNLFRKDAAIEL